MSADKRPKCETMSVEEAIISNRCEMPRWACDLWIFMGGYPQQQPVAVDNYLYASIESSHLTI